MWLPKLLFYLSLVAIFYVYLGYPAVAYLLSRVRNKGVHKASVEPDVSIIISAYNEEKEIEETLRNKLELDYPDEKMEIIVISDGSTDTTDEIVKQFGRFGVKLMRQEPRAGKTAAINLGVQAAKGEIIIFSDANSRYEKDAIRKLVRNFADPRVGYVTGRMVYTNSDGTTVGDGCTFYMKYENFLRRLETEVGSIVGVDGGIDAIRKKLYQPMSPDQLPDFVLPLKVVESGFRVVYEPDAILKEPSLKTSKDEYRMRVRVSLRALWALKDMRRLLTFKNFRLFSWQLWSHKVLRYLCFLFLIGVYASSLLLRNEGLFYEIVLIIQTVAYLFAIMNLVFARKGYAIRLFNFLSYFLLLNLASAHSFVKYLSGQKTVIWEPRKG